jgi:hypothetical protein
MCVAFLFSQKGDFTHLLAKFWDPGGTLLMELESASATAKT